MKKDIILCGVGGQGILSIAAAIGLAAKSQKLHLKQAEVHGMSQRGGAVQSHLRLSSEPIASDLIPYGHADVILSVEPMESLRYLPFLSETGILLTNSECFENISIYPDPAELYAEIKKQKNHVLIHASQIAKDCGSGKASNMVMLGAAAKSIAIPEEAFRSAIVELFTSKGDEITELNLSAFDAGRKAAENYVKQT